MKNQKKFKYKNAANLAYFHPVVRNLFTNAVNFRENKQKLFLTKFASVWDRKKYSRSSEGLFDLKPNLSILLVTSLKIWDFLMR